jgi:hypothetical protein
MRGVRDLLQDVDDRMPELADAFLGLLAGITDEGEREEDESEAGIYHQRPLRRTLPRRRASWSFSSRRRCASDSLGATASKVVPFRVVDALKRPPGTASIELENVSDPSSAASDP